MIYQKLLWSRTKSHDWRWLVFPESLTEPEAEVLRSIFDQYVSAYKTQFLKLEIDPWYFLSFSESSVLFQCKKTPYVEWQGRTIYALQGISVAHEYRRHMWFVLPWILKIFNQIVDVWQDLDFSEADNIKRHPRIISEQFNIAVVNNQTIDVPFLATSAGPKEQLTLPFTNLGFEQLVQALLMPETPFLNFAFGLTASMAQSHPFLDEFPIVSYVSPETGASPEREDMQQVGLTIESPMDKPLQSAVSGAQGEIEQLRARFDQTEIRNQQEQRKREVSRKREKSHDIWGFLRREKRE